MTFASKTDRENERQVAKLLMKKWGCKIEEFAGLNPIDWYAVRDNKIVAWMELKCRTNKMDEFPTVFLSARKFVALQMAALDGTPPLFVVRWADGQVRYINIQTIPVSFRLGGHANPRAKNDVEPIVEVPTSLMLPV